MAERKRVARRPARAARPRTVTPFESFSSFCQKKMDESPQLFHHLANSGIEFWKAVRSLIDWRIATLEARQRKLGGRRGVRKIRVTE